MKTSEIGLGSSLRALLAALDDGLEEVYAKEGEDFRPRFYPVVRMLLRHEPMKIGELAASAGVSQPAMTQTVSAMHRLGIVEIGEGKDHRARMIRLSAKGREQTSRLQRIWSATARAAEGLEAECDASLSKVARSYLGALERKSFIERIQEELE